MKSLIFFNIGLILLSSTEQTERTVAGAVAVVGHLLAVDPRCGHLNHSRKLFL